MKGDLCPCTCGEILHQHTAVFIAGQSHQAIKQDCSSSFSGSAVSGDRWFAPGLESVVEQHLPWTLKPHKALYGSPEDVWGIFFSLCWWCRLPQTTLFPKKFVLEMYVLYRQTEKFRSGKPYCTYYWPAFAIKSYVSIQVEYLICELSNIYLFKTTNRHIQTVLGTHSSQ